jgi:hypothetical protein
MTNLENVSDLSSEEMVEITGGSLWGLIRKFFQLLEEMRDYEYWDYSEF